MAMYGCGPSWEVYPRTPQMAKPWMRGSLVCNETDAMSHAVTTCCWE